MLGQRVRIEVTHQFFPDMEMHDRSEQAQLENPSGLAETILKLTRVAVQQPVSERALAATERLIAIVAQLSQPDSGWPSDLPMTPENLMPYVLEEAWEVLEALVVQPGEQGTRGDGETTRRGADSEVLLSSVAELISRGLWWTIASSYDAMRLIGGVEAVAIPPANQTPDLAVEANSGILRLVVGLNFAPHSWLVDLATQEVFHSKKDLSFLVAPGTLVQSPQVELCREPIDITTLSQHLQQHLITTAPTFATFCNFQPQKVEWLQPHSTWQQGEIFLSLDWQFFPQPDIATTPETALLPPQTRVKTGYLSVQPDWLLSTTFFDKLPRHNLNQIEKRDFIPQLVAAAIHIVATTERLWLIRPIVLNQWVPQIFWQILRTSYDISILLGGVAAAVLSPAGEWVAGTLRLVLLLQISSRDVAGAVVEQQIDLFTGSPIVHSHPLAPSAILQSRLAENHTETLWQIANPVTVTELLAQIQHPLEAADPFIKMLLNGRPIELQQDNYSPWFPGIAKLRLELELTPILMP